MKYITQNDLHDNVEALLYEFSTEQKADPLNLEIQVMVLLTWGCLVVGGRTRHHRAPPSPPTLPTPDSQAPRQKPSSMIRVSVQEFP